MYLVPNATPNSISGLGFSLKPPGWLTNIFQNATAGKEVSIPTPGGITVNVPLNSPTAFTDIAKMITGARITSTTPTSAPSGQPSFVDSIPGGWLTIGAVGLGALLLFRGVIGGGRRRKR